MRCRLDAPLKSGAERKVDHNTDMSDDVELQKSLSRQVRLVSVVIAATMVLWMLAQLIGGKLGLPSRYVFLFDLFALAGFAWALLVCWQIWRKRRATE